MSIFDTDIEQTDETIGVEVYRNDIDKLMKTTQSHYTCTVDWESAGRATTAYDGSFRSVYGRFGKCSQFHIGPFIGLSGYMRVNPPHLDPKMAGNRYSGLDISPLNYDANSRHCLVVVMEKNIDERYEERNNEVRSFDWMKRVYINEYDYVYFLDPIVNPQQFNGEHGTHWLLFANTSESKCCWRRGKLDELFGTNDLYNLWCKAERLTGYVSKSVVAEHIRNHQAFV